MAFYKINSKRSLFENETRTQWQQRLHLVTTLEECTKLLQSFRETHLGPTRSSYRHAQDSLWIANAIEQRLAQLKSVDLEDDALMHQCTTGETAREVCRRWSEELARSATYQAVEALALRYRQTYQPPVMPVNYWLQAERDQTDKLMLLRSRRKAGDVSLEELRAERGAKLVSEGRVGSFTVTARFEDGETTTFACREHENLIAAALRENTILLSQCREGQCGTCKAVCTSGAFDFGDGVNVYSLPQEEQDEGLILACQTYPRSDMTVDFPYSKDMVTFGSSSVDDTLLGRVHTLERCTPSVYRLVLEHLNPGTKRARQLSYTAGQFVNMHVPGTDQWRSFSLATPSRATGMLEFFIKIVPGGLFSSQFWEHCHPGKEVDLTGPFGMFHVNRHSSRRRVFVAGNSGIAPILAMLRGMKESQDDTPSVVLQVVDQANKNLCDTELAELQASMPQLTLHRCVLPDCGLAELLSEALQPTPEHPDVYICGPDALVHQTETICRAQEVPVRQVYMERFVPSGPDAALASRRDTPWR